MCDPPPPQRKKKEKERERNDQNVNDIAYTGSIKISCIPCMPKVLTSPRIFFTSHCPHFA